MDTIILQLQNDYKYFTEMLQKTIHSRILFFSPLYYIQKTETYYTYLKIF